MAQISITVPDATVTRIQTAFTAQLGYTGTAPDGTAETQAQFVRRMLLLYVKDTVRNYEAQQAAQTATQTAAAQVETAFGG